MANFALSSGKVRPVQTYCAAQFAYPGKVKISEDPTAVISDMTDMSRSTIYRSFRWLSSQNWIGKDEVNGWYFFRGIDRVHEMNGWQFSRAAVMRMEDLKTFKAFCIGAVLASLAKGGGAGTGRKRRRPEPSRSHLSLSVIATCLKVSESTAFRYRQFAEKFGYIKNKQSLVRVINWTPAEAMEYKRQEYDQMITVRLFGQPDPVSVSTDRLRSHKGKLYVQAPNLVTPYVALKRR